MMSCSPFGVLITSRIWSRKSSSKILPNKWFIFSRPNSLPEGGFGHLGKFFFAWLDGVDGWDTEAGYFGIDFNAGYHYQKQRPKSWGMSVRCIRD
jgi:hypothetical protein